MAFRNHSSLLAALAALGLASTLGGCAGVTYGTGTRAEMQTVEDLTGIVSLSGPKKDEIDYRPRGGIVVPPTADLPPVGGAKKVADANWPVDEDVKTREIRKARADAAKTGEAPANDPGFRLPKNATVAAPKTGDKEGFAAMAAAKAEKAAGTTDANGRPVRRFLTEPPADYRAPDPNAPVVDNPTPKKKKWWQFGSSS